MIFAIILIIMALNPKEFSADAYIGGSIVFLIELSMELTFISKVLGII